MHPTQIQNQKLSLVQYWKKSGLIHSQKLIEAFMQIQREVFIDEFLMEQAYADHPLPIGEGQTISQPTTIMLMIQLLKVESHHTILEVGAGSGYNAALLSLLCSQVITIERHHKVAKQAENNLRKNGCSNVTVVIGDGKLGLQNKSPFDRIIVTAAASEVPRNLKKQLKIQGLLVLPLGPPLACQMKCLKKVNSTHFKSTSHGLFSFVPLV